MTVHIQETKRPLLVAAQWKYTVWVGSARFVAQTDVGVGGRLPAGLAEFEVREAQKGRTLIYVAIASSVSNMSTALALALADAPKRSSARAIRALQDKGIEVNPMTGDGRETALVVARQVGIAPEGVWAGMSPAGKAGMVTGLMKRDGGGVAMRHLTSRTRFSARSGGNWCMRVQRARHLAHHGPIPPIRPAPAPDDGRRDDGVQLDQRRP
ncbi:hypothetical protein EDB92DRAFT_1818127 [Lactarius akahatsu]|uniref:Uncharacterized protein n=1 Tax=Lactarius akahatsu TaxID=416441 RepID=A0AAD4LGQ1_9AGAM|nr:hypothetical protein EDB92DRAFT_1818127 [Lactarius akahatsu]